MCKVDIEYSDLLFLKIKLLFSVSNKSEVGDK